MKLRADVSRHVRLALCRGAHEHASRVYEAAERRRHGVPLSVGVRGAQRVYNDVQVGGGGAEEGKSGACRRRQLERVINKDLKERNRKR